MSTRYSSSSLTRFGVAGLSSGYEGLPSSNVVIPPVGIEDVDRSLFNLFNEQIPLVVGVPGQDTKRVPVVFFAGERWAMNKRRRALKDRNNSLVLPLVTAVRTTVNQDLNADITGRGINQQTGEIVIRRRLDDSDRSYQSLINRLLLKNQTNVAVSPNQANPGQLTTIRPIGDMSDDPTVEQGGLLVPNHRRNVYETIVIPAPQFFTAQYEFTLWAQYTSHMRQMIEAIINSQLPQGNCWRLETSKGYWFVASVEGNVYNVDNNDDDYAQVERLIRYKFVVNVPGYVLASAVPGAPVPVRRYVSVPTITFKTTPVSAQIEGGAHITDPYIGADDPTLPSASEGNDLARADGRRSGGTRLYPGRNAENKDDPALAKLRRGTSPGVYKKVEGVSKNGRRVAKLFRVKNTNVNSGETVLSPAASMGSLSIVLEDD